MNLTSTSDKYTGRITKMSAYKIHELPPVPLPSINVKENHCLKTGSVFNPSNIQEDQGMLQPGCQIFEGKAGISLHVLINLVVCTFCY
jgi:hypothetical protein